MEIDINMCSRKYKFWKFYKQLKLGKLLKM